MTTRRGITIHLPVSLIWDEETTNAEEAERDLFRMLEEVEQAGFFDRIMVDINYGEPVERTPFVPEDEDWDGEEED